MTTWDELKNTHDNVGGSAKFEGYGVIGSDGAIGKILELNISDYKDGVSNHTFSKNDSGSGAFLFFGMSAKGTIGSLDIPATFR
ncbi:hypothetical protein [Paenibacillus sp. MSJ-34]|uniref:hypothetical protein n=1 Tax=Paenibacillus sp. MSJ-34 TaxID=2841529 RepID=UPI001C104C4F|nr:hypothetical protein [Paenibacillus sp. MSJ-34]MBU5445597.1 hypothetical protein [Paenibacillus sp. MSJ-34]